MKALIVYDSLYGNTQEAAQAIADSLRNNGVSTACVQIGHFTDNALLNCDMLILGSPTHYWNPTKQMNDFLKQLSRLRLNIRYASCFCTKLNNSMSGSAASKMGISLRKLRFTMVIKPLDLFVKSVKGPLQQGELQTSQRYAEAIAKSLISSALEV
jgi:flavodoxin I